MKTGTSRHAHRCPCCFAPHMHPVSPNAVDALGWPCSSRPD